MLRRLMLFALMSFVFLPATHAADTTATLLERWYDALRTADRAAFDALLADNAKVTIEDLGTVQDKHAYMEALDSWADAVKGATILYRLDTETPAAERAETYVCYRFTGNTVYAHETFRFSHGKVVESVQTTLDGPCRGF